MQCFCNSPVKRIHGTGQGTGCSPIVWSVVNVIVVEVMEQNQSGQVFRNPTGEIKAQLMVYSFVNDANLLANEAGLRDFNEKTG